jgi:protein-tyrosine-phosphatase
MSTILLVCTGNICRSPMATGVLSKLLSDRGVQDVRVESCGVSAWDGSPPTPEAVAAMREQGIDISGYVARRMNRRLIESSDVILGMSSEHRDAAKRLAPSASGRIFTLKELVHLLGAANSPPEERTPEQRLQGWIEHADAVRRAHPDLELTDEDIADPLGLGLQTYRASAWELGMLCESLVDAVFEAQQFAPTGEDVENEVG